MRGGDVMLFEGDLIGQFKLPENDHRALVITDGNDTYTILKSKDTDADKVKDTEYWGLLAKGKDGHSPSLQVSDDGYWVIDGQTTSHKAVGPTGSIANTVMLTDDTDVNFTVDNGLYLKTSGKAINTPNSVQTFTVIVFGNKTNVTQLLNSLSDNTLYVRTRNNGTWSDWRMITQWN